MTNFDKIADRIVAAEGVSFAIACAGGGPLCDVAAARNALKQAIVEALENVLIDTTNAYSSAGYDNA